MKTDTINQAGPRIQRSGSVFFTIYYMDGCPEVCRREWRAEIRDLSESGAGLILDRPVPVGASLIMRVLITDPDFIAGIDGEVRWCKPLPDSKHWRAGISFLHRSPEQAETWLNVMSDIRRANLRGEYAAA